MTKINEYDKQALSFLEKTQTEFKAVFKEYGKYFHNDEDKRDIWTITLKRGSRSYTFSFGQSVAHSGKYIHYNTGEVSHSKKSPYRKNPAYEEPTAYSVLACLQKDPPGTFKEFCDGYGYDDDSRTAEKIYLGVLEEWKNLQILYTDEELEELRNIN